MRAAIFIDGGYLLKQMQDAKVTPDYARLSEFLMAPLKQQAQLDLMRTYFYYCPPWISDRPTEDELRRMAAHERFVREIQEACDRWQIRLGKLERRRDGDKETFAQKRVDVQLSVDLVHHAAAGHIQHAILVAGDSDFIPAIVAAKASGATLTLWCDRDKSVHKELLFHADEVHYIDWQAFPSRRGDRAHAALEAQHGASSGNGGGGGSRSRRGRRGGRRRSGDRAPGTETPAVQGGAVAQAEGVALASLQPENTEMLRAQDAPLTASDAQAATSPAAPLEQPELDTAASDSEAREPEAASVPAAFAEPVEAPAELAAEPAKDLAPEGKAPPKSRRGGRGRGKKAATEAVVAPQPVAAAVRASKAQAAVTAEQTAPTSEPVPAAAKAAPEPAAAAAKAPAAGRGRQPSRAKPRPAAAPVLDVREATPEEIREALQATHQDEPGDQIGNVKILDDGLANGNGGKKRRRRGGRGRRKKTGPAAGAPLPS